MISRVSALRSRQCGGISPRYYRNNRSNGGFKCVTQIPGTTIIGQLGVPVLQRTGRPGGKEGKNQGVFQIYMLLNRVKGPLVLLSFSAIHLSNQVVRGVSVLGDC